MNTAEATDVLVTEARRGISSVRRRVYFVAGENGADSWAVRTPRYDGQLVGTVVVTYRNTAVLLAVKGVLEAHKHRVTYEPHRLKLIIWPALH